MKRSVSQAVVLLLMSVAAGVAAHFWHPQAPAWYLVDAPPPQDEVELSTIPDPAQVLWLDARPDDQYAQGHVPGAHLLNEQGFDQQLFELLEVLQTNTLPVVVYCAGERCEASRRVKEKLLETLPLENVRILKGGWKSWVGAGRAVER